MLNSTVFNSLARRQHILTADTSLSVFPVVTDFNSFSPFNNDRFEHDSISLSEWEVVSIDTAKNDKVVDTCFNYRPAINLRDTNMPGLHMLMCQGISSIAVQWEYPYVSGTNLEYRWWPSGDPDGNPLTADSDFGVGAMNANRFGIYFNVRGGVSPASYWYGPEQARTQAGGQIFTAGFYPRALKFTFTLYDSKGVIKGGQTFTHIVYLEN
jgi:hypothetical protein